MKKTSERKHIRITMLGSFALRSDEGSVEEYGSRSRKSWLLLAFLILNRGRVVSQEELLDLLWDDDGSNPGNALKTMLHRVRTGLGELYENAGFDMIQAKPGGYTWNNNLDISIDTESFEQLCNEAAAEQDAARKNELYMQALDYYDGDLLPDFATESWIIPLHTRYHNLCLKATMEALVYLEESGRYEEAAALCRRIVPTDPGNEELVSHLMQSLLRLGDLSGVVAEYERLSERLFSDYGVLPSESVRELYRQVFNTENDKGVDMDELLAGLQETSAIQGALVCGYDFFRLLYQAKVRLFARSGELCQMVLFTVNGWGGRDMNRRSLDRAMENLMAVVRDNLRTGDMATRRSVCQIAVMLQGADEENGEKVCQRVERFFRHRYPHSPAEISHEIRSMF